MRKTHNISPVDGNLIPIGDLPPTKERILRIAEKLFAEKGFEGSRTRDIAEQANVNISTLHFHWKSKEDLYTAVYQRQIARRTEFAKEIVALLKQAVNSQRQWTDLARDVVDQLFNFFYRYPHAARLDSYRLLEATAPHTTVQQSQALLFSVAEQLRGLLLSPSASPADVALIILSVNVLVREYFTSPEFFRQLLGEQSQETTENRLKRHMQQSIERLLQLLANRR